MNFISTNSQKILLNLLLIVAIGFVEAGGVYLIFKLMPENFFIIHQNKEMVNPNLFSFISVSLIIGWLGILLAYYAWAIYFYNINLGYTNEDWAKIKKKRAEAETLQKLGEVEGIMTYKIPADNPYKDETFGLPNGTVRGTIALSLLVGGFSLLILSQNPAIYEQAEVVEKYLEYFKTAFLMMIAFYFGSQSLKFFKSPSVVAEENKPEIIKPPITVLSPETQKDTFIQQKAYSSPQTTANISKDERPILKEEKSLPELPAPVAKVISLNESNRKISEEDIAECAAELEIEPALINAVIKVESSGSGFLSDGRPKILFEGHIFWDLLIKKGKKPQDYATAHPDIVYPSWTKKYYSSKMSDEYKRLDKAVLIDEDSAYQSASWGLFQIMGMNYKKAGFETVHDFVAAQKESETSQLKSFINFIKNEDLITYLKKYDWRGFALRYNGKGYEANNYHTKLEKAYSECSKLHTPTIKATLKRTISNEKETLGDFTLFNADRPIFSCKTLELPWKENKTNISCIPVGKYKVEKRFSQEYHNHFHITDVKDRAWILIHAGNYYTDTRGCVLVGNEFIDINKDGFKDVANSKLTLQKLNQVTPEKFDLEIISTPV